MSNTNPRIDYHTEIEHPDCPGLLLLLAIEEGYPATRDDPGEATSWEIVGWMREGKTRAVKRFDVDAYAVRRIEDRVYWAGV